LSDEVTTDIRDLLAEVRELLLPISDAYRAQYERRNAVRDLLSTDKRKTAWALADGTLNQGQIAKEAGMAKGGASVFFKALRDIDAIVDDPNPKRAMEV
jgi:hypothetical protein